MQDTDHALSKLDFPRPAFPAASGGRRHPADESRDLKAEARLTAGACRPFAGLHYEVVDEENGILTLRLFPREGDWASSRLVFTLDEMVEKFELRRVSHSPAAFDPQKLEWMNGHYLREAVPHACLVQAAVVQPAQLAVGALQVGQVGRRELLAVEKSDAFQIGNAYIIGHQVSSIVRSKSRRL